MEVDVLTGVKVMHEPQYGFSLIEVLIVIVITAISLLGIAGLQATSLKAAKTGSLRSVANQLTGDLTDRMRANMLALRDASGLPVSPIAYATSGTYAATAGVVPAVAPCTAPCSPAEMAASDIAAWRIAVAQALPGGTGFVSGDLANGFQIVVAWAERSSVTGETSFNIDCPTAIAAPAEVRCFNTLVRL
jgi:type IV pilus assembly protein PilV